MTIAPDYFTYDGDPEAGIVPCRPSLDQLGGGRWINKPNRPPDPETMPYAEAFNQGHKVLAGACRVLPVARISVIFSGGAPVIAYFKTMGTLITGSTLTVARTGGGDAAGDVTVTWPADTFPLREANPSALTINSDTAITEMRAIPVSNGVRVRTKASGTGTDASWTVDIHGQ
jgi:hypothetical protein